MESSRKAGHVEGLGEASGAVTDASRGNAGWRTVKSYFFDADEEEVRLSIVEAFGVTVADLQVRPKGRRRTVPEEAQGT